MGESDGFVFSNEENGYGGVFMTPPDFQNINQYNFQSANQSICVDAELQGCTESGSKRIRLSPDFNHQELEEGGDRRGESSPLGLKLTKTPSFLSLLEMRLSKGKQTNPTSAHENHVSNRMERQATKMDEGSQASIEREKLKASNFPAILIKIGSWQRFPKHEGDLIAKLYYAKRKLVWEVLDGPLKSKIEIQWSDIIAIRATTPDGEPGTLEIELNQPPLFYRETNPQPRKHTLWQQASDFTGGQAPIWRRHLVRFPPGILDKNYEKLLHCDPRLFAMSKKPFPSHESPYFDSTMFGTSLNFSRGVTPRTTMHYPYWTSSSTPRATPNLIRATPNSSLSVLDLPLSYGERTNYQIVNQQQALLDQRLNIPKDNFGILGSFDMSSHVTSVNNLYASTNYGDGLGNNIETNLLDGGTLLPNIDSMCSLLEPVGVNNIANYHSEMAYHVTNDSQVMHSALNYPSYGGLHNMVSESAPINWMTTTQDSVAGAFGLPISDNHTNVGGFFSLNSNQNI